MNPARRMTHPRQARGLARWIVLLAVLALLLKAAVPLLASAAARLQGVAVGEVCELYGVAPALLKLQPPHIFLRPPVGRFRVLDFLKARDILEQSAPVKDDLKRAIDAVHLAARG